MNSVLRGLMGVSACVLAVTSAQAETVTFIGSGTGQGEPISASATLEIVKYDFGARQEITNPLAPNVLKVTLTNTAPATTQPADLLTGFFLTVDPDLLWGTSASSFDGTAPILTTASGISTNVDIAPAVNGTPTDGGWVLTNGETSSGYFGTYSGINLTAYNVGLSTVGAGYPGVKGADVGPPADNYGIYSAGTSSLSTSLNQMLPLIKGTAVFYMKPTSGLNSLDQILGVAFVYGSKPSYKLEGRHLPLPSGLLLLLTGVGPAALVVRRLRRAEAA
jgi:hypothetical protein